MLAVDEDSTDSKAAVVNVVQLNTDSTAAGIDALRMGPVYTNLRNSD
jgi:hypothetical protein